MKQKTEKVLNIIQQRKRDTETDYMLLTTVEPYQQYLCC